MPNITIMKNEYKFTLEYCTKSGNVKYIFDKPFDYIYFFAKRNSKNISRVSFYVKYRVRYSDYLKINNNELASFVFKDKATLTIS